MRQYIMTNLINEAPVTLDVAKNNRKFINIPKEVFDKMSSLGFDDIGKGGYTNWVLDKYLKSDEGSKSRFVEDLYKVAESLKAFDVKKNKGFWKDPKDINQYKAIGDLRTAVDKYEGIRAKNEFKVSSKDVSEEDIDVVYEDSDWIVKVPKTREASCVLGRSTEWCTASQGEDNMFDHYTKSLYPGTKLYVITNKNDPSQKYQFHNDSNQFMDSKDNQIGIGTQTNFPEFSDELFRFLASISDSSINMSNRIRNAKRKSQWLLILLQSPSHEDDKELWTFDNVMDTDNPEVLKKFVERNPRKFSDKYLDSLFMEENPNFDMIKASFDGGADLYDGRLKFAKWSDNAIKFLSSIGQLSLVDFVAIDSLDEIERAVSLGLDAKSNPDDLLDVVMGREYQIEHILSYLFGQGMRPSSRKMTEALDMAMTNDDPESAKVLIDNGAQPSNADAFLSWIKDELGDDNEFISKIKKESYYSYINSYLTESVI